MENGQMAARSLKNQKWLINFLLIKLLQGLDWYIEKGLEKWIY